MTRHGCAITLGVTAAALAILAEVAWPRPATGVGPWRIEQSRAQKVTIAKGLAHAFVSFGFGADTWLAVSVEARRRPGEDFALLPALLGRFELIYVLADERVVVNERAIREKVPVYCYPVRAPREALRRLFLATMARVDGRIRALSDPWSAAFFAAVHGPLVE